MYGWRARIGLLVPSINTTMEPEMWGMVPEGISVHTARIAGGRKGTPETLQNMENEGKEAASRLAMAEPNVVIYSCTSGSFFKGPGWDKEISSELSTISNCPAITTSGAMVSALKSGGLRKISVVTPYVEITNERLKNFLKAEEIDVKNLDTFDMLDMFDHAKVEPDEIYKKVKSIASNDVDGIFVACTQLRALEVLEMLEQDIGLPVYSAVQASAWNAFKILGIDPKLSSSGSLLRTLSNKTTPNFNNKEILSEQINN